MRHLKIYRTIRAIHRYGSIRKAAEALSTSPSALNRALQGFEEELGVPVFDRVPGGVDLTPAGELLIVQIDRHLIEFDELHRDLRKLRDGLSGHITISLGQDIDAGVIMSAIAGFEAAHPGVSVTLISANTLAPLRDRHVDLAIATSPETDDKIDVIYARLVGVAAWLGPEVAEIGGLWDLVPNRIVIPPDTTGTCAVFRHALRRQRLEAQVTTTAASSQMPAMLMAGSRACIAPTLSMTYPGRSQATPRFGCMIGETQIAILRAAGVPLRKAVMAAAKHVQAALEDSAEGLTASATQA